MDKLFEMVLAACMVVLTLSMAYLVVNIVGAL